MGDDLEHGLSLDDAIEEYSDPEKWRTCLDAAARSAGRRQVDLIFWRGEPIAGWDAYHETQANNALIRAHKEAKAIVLDEFMRKLRSGELVATGLLAPITPDTKRQPIKADLWSVLQPNFARSSASGGGCEFLGVQVSRHPGLPLQPETPDHDPTPDVERSFPGRPSIMRRIEQEMRDRAQRGELRDRLRAECRDLAQWAGRQFEGVQVPKLRSIENALRDVYSRLRAQKPDM